VRARHPDICILVITGYPSLEHIRGIFTLNVFAYLTKPFSPALCRAFDKQPSEVLASIDF